MSSPLLHLPARAVQQALAHWREHGWPSHEALLVGWQVRAVLGWPAHLPPSLRPPGCCHVACEAPTAYAVPMTGSQDTADALEATERRHAHIAALDLLFTDDAPTAALAQRLGVPVWLMGAHAPGRALSAEEREQAMAPGALSRWLDYIAPTLTQHVQSRLDQPRIDADMDEQNAVQAAFGQFQQGDAPRARETATRLLVTYPHRTDLWQLAGVVAQQAQDLDSAVACFEQITQRTPGYPDGWRHLAAARLAQGRAHEALEATGRWVALAPTDARARSLHSSLLQAAGRPEDAATEAANALLLKPDDLASVLQRGHTLIDLGQRREAAAVFRQGLRRHPGAADLRFHLATTLRQLDASTEAALHFEHLIDATPEDHPWHRRALSALAAIQSSQRLWRTAAATSRQLHALDAHDLDNLRRLVLLNRQLGHPERAAALLSAQAADAPLPPDLAHTQALAHRDMADWTHDAGDAPPPVPPPTPTQSTARERSPRRQGDTLRIAYAYASQPDGHDLRWIQAVIAHHDTTRYEALACHWGDDAVGDISDIATGDARDAANASPCLDMTGLDDAQVAEALQDAQVDVLLDLEGQRLRHRAGVLARHPVTLQISWRDRLTGPIPPWLDLALCAHRAADASAADARQIRLPQPRPQLAQRSLSEVGLLTPASRRLAGLPERAPVLACWAAPSWIDPSAFAVWMRALAAHPGAVLWLDGSVSAAPTHLRQAAAQQGIDPGRLLFNTNAQRAAREHWLALADLHLPAGPVDDLETLSAAVAIGLPVLAMSPASETPPWLTPHPLLAAAQVPSDPVLVTPDTYEQRLMALLRQPRALVAQRRPMPDRHRLSADLPPLFDLARYARNVENVIQEWWER